MIQKNNVAPMYPDVAENEQQIPKDMGNTWSSHISEISELD